MQLHHHTPRRNRPEQPRTNKTELIVPAEGELDGEPEAFEKHDGDGAHQGSDGDVHERRFAPVGGRDEGAHHYGENDDGEAVEEETCAR